ncbi:SCO family protein [Lentibacillus cibarius]|nr:SCO family protein [Lentibacillus cibarius]
MKRFKTMALPALLLTLFLTACGEEFDTNMSKDVSDFEFTTQDNGTLSKSDLEGEWWIADFVFTSCTTVCPPMTMNMAELQQKMKEENLDAQIVSFSVDPERDTPEALKKYAKKYQADLSNWTFLTGYDFQTIKEFSIKSFKSLVKRPPEGSDQITHGIRFFLINPEGKVIKNYNGKQSEVVQKVLDDLKIVLN